MYWRGWTISSLPVRNTDRVEEIDEYADAVLAALDLVPPGRITSYGRVAQYVGKSLGRGGPRQVAKVMRDYGASVAWYRCVKSDRSLAVEVAWRQAEMLSSEGIPLRNGRVPKVYWYDLPS